MKIFRLYLSLIFLLIFSSNLNAQQVNIENALNIRKKKFITLSGGISSNITHFHSNEMGGRQPFIYQLNGNLNLSFFEQFNIPLSFNLNNYGANFSYPTLPNRISLHPSYKWIRAHIGDVSMAFSPYTLNGHLFTGAGIELSPGKWNICAMGGRLVKKVDYDTAIPSILPTFNRYGYGGKVRYNGDNYFVGGTFFSAKDRTDNYNFQADSLGIFPRSNVVLSLEGGISLIPNLTLSAEYAISMMTRDTRVNQISNNLTDKTSSRNTSASNYDAFKADLTYTFKKNNIGIGYERISPRYETLGAYYFNNDYENLILNYARPLFQDKANIALSAGVQRDDLENDKAEKNNRFVGSVNFSFSPNERLNTSVSASSFQSYRNIKSTFEYVNAVTPYENLDTLNFTQLSNNIDFNLTYLTKKTDEQSQNLMLFVSFQQAADKQGGYILPGNLTTFFNLSTTYGFDFIPQNLNIQIAANVSNSYAGQKNMLTFGPTLSSTVRLFNKTLSTGISLSYNRTQEKASLLGEVFTGRWNANFRFLKKHSLQGCVLFQNRKRTNATTFSYTSMLTYAYSF
ncbi:MAG: hypothetical protein Q4G48_07680 [Bacteroidia bacterium]|nr:hypothetical protein [Bacteroidia bacterium]